MNGKYRLFYTLLGVANTSVLSGAFGKATDYADGYLLSIDNLFKVSSYGYFFLLQTMF